jgi:MFS superfamily sulfate permease-like transporter
MPRWPGWRPYPASIASSPPGSPVSQTQAPLETVVVDCSVVPTIDVTALASLRAFAATMKRQGIAVRLAELRDDVADSLRRRGAEADLGPIVAHRTVDQWVAARINEKG